MVHQKHNENNHGLKRSQTKKKWKWPDKKDPYSKPSGKENYDFFEHINRADGLEIQILSGKIFGTKSRGRQRTKYTDSLNNFVTRKEYPNSELIRRTGDRENWMAMSATDLAHDDDDDDEY